MITKERLVMIHYQMIMRGLWREKFQRLIAPHVASQIQSKQKFDPFEFLAVGADEICELKARKSVQSAAIHLLYHSPIDGELLDCFSTFSKIQPIGWPNHVPNQVP